MREPVQKHERTGGGGQRQSRAGRAKGGAGGGARVENAHTGGGSRLRGEGQMGYVETVGRGVVSTVGCWADAGTCLRLNEQGAK